MIRGGPTPPSKIVDREADTKFLVSKMKSNQINHNIAVIGYRRIGKTSILNKVKQELIKQNIIVVYFDVKKNMAEPKMFLGRLQKDIFNAYIKKLGSSARIRAKTDKTMAIFADIKKSLSTKKITIGAQITLDGTIMPTMTLGGNQDEHSTLFYSVFDTITAFSNKSNIKFVIILDEFQDMYKLRNYNGLKNIFDLFRSVIQERGEKVSFIISGSRVHMLKTVLGSGESALFAHFDIREIGELDEKSSIRLFNRNIRAGKKTVYSDGARDAYALVGGHPLYLTTLAESWDGIQDISELLENMITKSTGILHMYCEYMLSVESETVVGGPLSRTILGALSGSQDGLSYSQLAKKIMRPMTGLPKYVNALIAADLVIKEEGKFVIRDRILRRYLEIESEGMF